MTTGCLSKEAQGTWISRDETSMIKAKQKKREKEEKKKKEREKKEKTEIVKGSMLHFDR